MTDETMKDVEFLQGEGGSFAQKMADFLWIVSGDAGVLSELDPGEYGYRIANLTPELLHQLPDIAPVYAGAYRFKDDLGDESRPLTDNFETKEDVLKTAGEVIDNVQAYLGDDADKYMKPASEKQREELACELVSQLTWQGADAYGPEFEEDIEGCFDNGELDAYPMLFKQDAVEPTK